jgi:hypothetical protein
MEQMGTLGVETHKLSVRFQTLTKNVPATLRTCMHEKMHTMYICTDEGV